MPMNGVGDLHSSKQTPTRNRSPTKGVYNISGWEWQGHKHLVEEYKRADTKVKKSVAKTQ